MSPSYPMLVLVIGEAGLRTTLIARLSMAGADLVTVDNVDDPRIQRWLEKGAVLILDEVKLAAHKDGEAALCADPRWRAITVIGGKATDAALPSRVSRARAAVEIEAMLPGWGYPER